MVAQIEREIMKFRSCFLLGAFLASACLAFSLFGCTMGPKTSISDASVASANGGHNIARSTFFDSDGNPTTWTGVTTGATSEIQQGDDGVTANYTGTMPNSGTIFLPGNAVLDGQGKMVYDPGGAPIFTKPKSVSFVAASNMDMTIGELKLPDGTVIKDFTWSVKTSETIRALNEALDRFKEIWPKLSEEQRKALEATVNQIAPGLFKVLEMLATGAIAARDAPVDTATAIKLREALART